MNFIEGYSLEETEEGLHQTLFWKSLPVGGLVWAVANLLAAGGYSWLGVSSSKGALLGPSSFVWFSLCSSVEKSTTLPG